MSTRRLPDQVEHGALVLDVAAVVARLDVPDASALRRWINTEAGQAEFRLLLRFLAATDEQFRESLMIKLRESLGFIIHPPDSA